MAVEKVALETFSKLLLHHSAQRGERPAIREKRRGIWRTLTWRDLADEAAAIATALAKDGLERGAHVILVGDNRPRLYAAMCAVHALGGVAVPLYQDATADEMAPSVQSAEATHAFAENQEQVDKLLKILPECPALRRIVYDKDRGMRHYRQPQLLSYETLLQQGRELTAANGDFFPAEAARGSGQDAAFLFFTSGTTGPAKGVVLTHSSLIDRARAVAATEQLTDADLAMAYLPPGWIGQNLFSYVQPMVVGYCIACPESSETMLADMREIGPTYLLATPRVLEALLTQVSLRIEDAGGFNQGLFRRCMTVGRRVASRRLAGKPVSLGDRFASALCNILIHGPLRDALGMSRVRVAFTAGDTIAPDLLIFYRALGVNLKQLYGSTETGFLVAMQRDGEVRPDTVGRATEGVELRITAQREILVRSPGLFREYHRDPQATKLARNGDGWFHTGDAGYLDEQGHLRIIDRMANVGSLKDGALLAPKLLENRLKGLPYLKEAVAFGEGRDMVCALVDIDVATVGSWADRQAIAYTGHADLASRDEVYELIAEHISKVNSDLAAEPTFAKVQIHRFAILNKELNADDGALTRTGKLRRAAIAERYGLLVEAMYAGRTESRHEDGDVDVPSADLKIRDARVFAPMTAGRSA